MKVKEIVCTECEYVGRPEMQKPGSSGMELFIWATVFVFGPFYSFWRIASKKPVCPQCGGIILTTMDSRVGKVIAEKKGLLTEDKDLPEEKISQNAHEEWEKIQEEIKQQELAKTKERGKREKQDPEEW